MRTTLFGQRSVIILGALLVMLAGCASSPSSKFYQLAPVQDKTSVTHGVSSEQSPIIAIGPVNIPDYLDRSQIVTRSGKNELKLAEFNRWAGSLENDIVRVLVENISAQLPPDRFFVVRWTPLLSSQVPVSYNVELHVDRFEGTLGDSVLLRAQWAVLGKDNHLLLKKESRITEQMNGSSYDVLVAAMSSALEKLGRDIAGGIGSVQEEPKK